MRASNRALRQLRWIFLAVATLGLGDWVWSYRTGKHVVIPVNNKYSATIELHDAWGQILLDLQLPQSLADLQASGYDSIRHPGHFSLMFWPLPALKSYRYRPTIANLYGFALKATYIAPENQLVYLDLAIPHWSIVALFSVMSAIAWCRKREQARLIGFFVARAAVSSGGQSKGDAVESSGEVPLSFDTLSRRDARRIS